MDPLDGFIAGLVEGDTFIQNPWEPTITRMHAAVVTLQLSRLCLPDNHTAWQDRPLGSY